MQRTCNSLRYLYISHFCIQMEKTLSSGSEFSFASDYLKQELDSVLVLCVQVLGLVFMWIFCTKIKQNLMC